MKTFTALLIFFFALGAWAEDEEFELYVSGSYEAGKADS